MHSPDRDRLSQMNQVYETYGKPLEAEHWGEFVAIAPDGRTVLASTLGAALAAASENFGSSPDNFVFKIGERVVATLR